MVTVVRVGPDKSGQVRTGVKYYFSSTVSPTLFKFGPPQTCVQFPNRTSLDILRPSEVVESTLRHASVGVRCELVWSATFLRCTTTSERSFESSWSREFECEISPGLDLKKKVMPFNSSGANAVWAYRLGTTTKRCKLQLFFAGIRQAVPR